MTINQKKMRNIGILAHVDAGKTTLTEHILYQTQVIRKIGRVDQGTALTDSMEIERQRGISVMSASATCYWKDTQINIIDTPGHVDFSAEVERALLALDGVILVISAIEGVQAQTEVIMDALYAMKIPTIIYVNKIDYTGFEMDVLLHQINRLTKDKAVPIQAVKYSEHGNMHVEPWDLQDSSDLRDDLILTLSELDVSIRELVLQDQLSSLHDINNSIKQLCHTQKIFPLLFGSALKGIGIEEVLDAIVAYLPEPQIMGLEEVIGVVYKIKNSPNGKMAHVRLYEGHIKVRDSIYNQSKKIYEKVTHLFQVNGNQYKPVDYLSAGEIGVIGGLNQTKIGDLIGENNFMSKNYKLASPTLTVKVYPSQHSKLDRLVEILLILEEEDPLLNVSWKQEERELTVQLMGVIQMEILTNVIKTRFNVDVLFERPTVVYKETASQIGTGYIEMRTPYFGSLEMKVEPLKRGSGIIYESRYSTDWIFPRFQTEVEEVYQQVLREGGFGWNVTDVRVMLTGGRSIKLATHPGDFKHLTPMALMNAIKDSKPILLEPINQFNFCFHIQDAGMVFHDLYQMRAEILNQEIIGDFYHVEGVIPLSTSIDYPKSVAALSEGKSKYQAKFKGYQECPLELGQIRQRRTVDPSDQQNYLFSVSSKGKRDYDTRLITQTY